MIRPYQITPEILQLITSVSEKIGQINAKFLDKPSPKLRKENRIKTIHSSLSIEGNTLSEEQITAANQTNYRQEKWSFLNSLKAILRRPSQ